MFFRIENPVFLIIIYNNDGLRICQFGTSADDIKVGSVQDRGEIEVWVDSIPLLLSKYYIYVSVQDSSMMTGIDYWHGAIYNQYFRILPETISNMAPGFVPICNLPHKWRINGVEIKPEE